MGKSLCNNCHDNIFSLWAELAILKSPLIYFTPPCKILGTGLHLIPEALLSGYLLLLFCRLAQHGGLILELLTQSQNKLSAAIYRNLKCVQCNLPTLARKIDLQERLIFACLQQFSRALGKLASGFVVPCFCDRIH